MRTTDQMTIEKEATVAEQLKRGNLLTDLTMLESQADGGAEPVVSVERARALAVLGRWERVRELCHVALDADGCCTPAMTLLAEMALRTTSDVDEACAWYERAWTCGEHAADWVQEWILLLVNKGSADRAVPIARRYSEEAGSATAYFLRGYTAHLTGDRQAALAGYLRCAARDSKYPMLCNNMAGLYLEMGYFDTAIELAREAVAQDQANAMAFVNLAGAHLKSRQIDAALLAAERALVLQPGLARASQIYSYVMKEHGKWAESLVSIKRAQTLSPNDGPIQWSLAMLQLVHGDYRNGLASHEARWHSGELQGKLPAFAKPRWYGEALKGKTLLIWGEQGHGDVIQMLRFIPLLARHVRAQGGRVVYCAFPELHALVSRTLAGVIDECLVSTLTTLPPHDYQVPLGSLPLMLGMDLKSLPVAGGYLKTDGSLVSEWKSKLGEKSRQRVGIAWTGSVTHQRNAHRSVPPAQLAKALSGLSHLEFHSLQVGASPQDLDMFRENGVEIIDHSAELTSFDQTAALVANLDHVLTVCTSVAHLCGALGVPGSVLLDVNPHWVWLLDRKDSPWYASLSLYRQEAFGDWSLPLAQVVGDLRAI